MPITQFSVGASRTKNLGNFESLRIEATVTVDVPDYANLVIKLEDGTQLTADGDQAPLSIANTLRAQAQEQLRQLLTDTYHNMTKKDGEKK